MVEKISTRQVIGIFTIISLLVSGTVYSYYLTESNNSMMTQTAYFNTFNQSIKSDTYALEGAIAGSIAGAIVLAGFVYAINDAFDEDCNAGCISGAVLLGGLGGAVIGGLIGLMFKKKN